MEVVKIKSYAYTIFNLFIWTAILCVPVYIVVLILVYNDVNAVLPRDIIILSIVFASIIAISAILAIILYCGCRTFDFYTKSGFIRVRRKKQFGKSYRIIYDVKWFDISEIVYCSRSRSFFFDPDTITLVLNHNIAERETSLLRYHETDSDNIITAKMPKKYLKKVEQIVPIEIRHDKKSK